jgi:hypothetical protein
MLVMMMVVVMVVTVWGGGESCLRAKRQNQESQGNLGNECS